MLALELGFLHFKINSTFYGKGNWTNHLASRLTMGGGIVKPLSGADRSVGSNKVLNQSDSK